MNLKPKGQQTMTYSSPKYRHKFRLENPDHYSEYVRQTKDYNSDETLPRDMHQRICGVCGKWEFAEECYFDERTAICRNCR